MPQPIEKSLERMLDFCTQKQKVISKNVANIGTENYQREDVKFKDLLTENIAVMKTTNAKHFAISNGANNQEQFETIEDNSNELTSGVNNVNIDTEMAEMAENTLKFKFASKKIGDYYRNIQNVIKSGAGR